MTTEQIHETGVKRHGATWARANRRAVDALTGCELKPWSPGVKDAVSRVVLRVLDGAQLDAGNEWKKDNGRWTARTDKEKENQFMADPNMTTVNISKAVHARLRLLHDKTKVPVGALVEMALESYLKRREGRKGVVAVSAQ